MYYEGKVLVLSGIHRRSDSNRQTSTSLTLLCGETLRVTEEELVRLVERKLAKEKEMDMQMKCHDGAGVAQAESLSVILQADGNMPRDIGLQESSRDVSTEQDKASQLAAKLSKHVTLSTRAPALEEPCGAASASAQGSVPMHNISAMLSVEDGREEAEGEEEEVEDSGSGFASWECPSSDVAGDGASVDSPEDSLRHPLDSSEESEGEAEGKQRQAKQHQQEEEEEEEIEEIEEVPGELEIGAGEGGLQWELIEGMWRQVSLPGSLAHINGHLFCMADIASSLREFDKEEKLWKEVCTMPYPQKGFQLVALNGGLLLLGVYGGHWLIPQKKISPGEEIFKAGRKRQMVHWAGLASLHSEAVGWTTLTL